ncbi:hypothetical protein BVRB_8g199010 [Beta vulgaris subsp. vulgaris]|nr:hypothetical protein BVRB_8g199010 [Beta vulgaris subsp. vulgaris]
MSHTSSSAPFFSTAVEGGGDGGSSASLSLSHPFCVSSSASFIQIVGLTNAMIKHCKSLDGLEDAIDIVGTGGDGANTVNISTGASILAVACGVKVAKVASYSLLLVVEGNVDVKHLVTSLAGNLFVCAISSGYQVVVISL